MKPDPAKLRLYLVTDPILCSPTTLLDTVVAAVRGGVTFVQLRDKDASTQTRIETARAVHSALEGSNVPLVINDDLDAAIAAGADGVHIGQSDINATKARALLGPDKIIGLSCETPDQVCAADPNVVTYIGLGTVFPTATKADHKPTIGLAGLANMVRLTTLPTVAIGGLKAEHAAAVIASGCDGMAVVSAICGQPDPEAAARLLCCAFPQKTGAQS
ncbi:thiamine phosphate synthase [Lentibacter sp. XHP0401]|jgi:thiamine-phosphate pyrophosphorylase|uniref:thiamine phosphate synthase n=1 Tax=Lentibacter sp. XHP0401 TaxID=2984334 RepID=UPI0021E93543|nr:thiamine phosphate synthase [Lentibacter sp. XHP0401]MCV2892756.1 thiamine phosphate synthase [Lentibacter sp. XHP0401]